MKVTAAKKSYFIILLFHIFQIKIKVMSKSEVHCFLRMSNQLDEQPTQMQGQLTGHETNPAIQEHAVDFGWLLRMFVQVLRVELTLVFLSASRMLRMKSSVNLLPTNVDSPMKVFKNFVNFSRCLN